MRLTSHPDGGVFLLGGEYQNNYLEVSWYSLEQYIGCIIRQAFNYHCSLLQVWREAENQALMWDLEAKEV